MSPRVTISSSNSMESCSPVFEYIEYSTEMKMNIRLASQLIIFDALEIRKNFWGEIEFLKFINFQNSSRRIRVQVL